MDDDETRRQYASESRHFNGVDMSSILARADEELATLNELRERVEVNRSNKRSKVMSGSEDEVVESM